MRLFKQILVNNDCYKTGKTITPKGVMWHSTGANNPNLRRYVQPDDGTLGYNRYGNHWNRGRVAKCVHAFIGKDKNGQVATYQTLPWDMRGWHAGSGKKGSANDTHIAFEICEANLTDVKYFNQIYKEACELTAHLCKTFNLNPMADGVIICHAEGYKRGIAGNHGDVLHWFKRHNKTMDDVRRDVKKLMEEAEKPATPAVATLKLGQKVKLKKGAQYVSGKTPSSWVYRAKLYVRRINGEKITVSTLKVGAVTGTVYAKDLTII